jgi:hypothetical protein
MKKKLSFTLSLLVILLLISPLSVFAGAITGLTWDGKPATLAEIDKNCGFAEYYGEGKSNFRGNYVVYWYDLAKELWEQGLFLGSDGSFDLDQPLTRAQGVVMTIRLLGKEGEAKAHSSITTFTDVPEWAKPYVAYAVENGIVKGYSATTFGANDPMTATQYITLVLRAMGYEDEEDFTWDKSYEKAMQLGLFGSCEYAQYSRSNLFLRDDAVGLAYNAVFYTPAKSGGFLKDIITMPGKPLGSVPAAKRIAGSDIPDYEVVKHDNFFQIYSLPGGNYNASANYFINVKDYRGPVDFKVTISPAGVGDTATYTYHVEGDTEEDLYINCKLSFKIKPAAYGEKISNTIKLEFDDFIYTDTVSVNGTLYSVKIQ